LIRLALWASIGFLGWAGWIFLQPPKAVVLPYEFTVRPGQSLASVSRELAAQRHASSLEFTGLNNPAAPTLC
jgi:hypothetical protein